MVTSAGQDVNDFIKCEACYDEDVRKLNFLPCSHNICLLCRFSRCHQTLSSTTNISKYVHVLFITAN